MRTEERIVEKRTTKEFSIGDRVRGQRGEWRQTGTFLGHGLIFSDLPKEGLIYVGPSSLGRMRKQVSNPEHAALLAKLFVERLAGQQRQCPGNGVVTQGL